MLVFWWLEKEGERDGLTHGRHAYQRRRDTGVETLREETHMLALPLFLQLSVVQHGICKLPFPHQHHQYPPSQNNTPEKKKTKGKKEKTHPNQPLPCNRPPHHIHSTLVYTLLGRLQPHLDQVEGVAHDDGAHAADAASGQRAQALQRRLGRLGHVVLQLVGAGQRRDGRCRLLC